MENKSNKNNWKDYASFLF